MNFHLNILIIINILSTLKCRTLYMYILMTQQYKMNRSIME